MHVDTNVSILNLVLYTYNYVVVHCIHMYR